MYFFLIVTSFIFAEPLLGIVTCNYCVSNSQAFSVVSPHHCLHSCEEIAAAECYITSDGCRKYYHRKRLRQKCQSASDCLSCVVKDPECVWYTRDVTCDLPPQFGFGSLDSLFFATEASHCNSKRTPSEAPTIRDFPKRPHLPPMPFIRRTTTAKPTYAPHKQPTISPTSSPTDSPESVKIHWYETLRPTHAPYFQRRITTMSPMDNQPQNPQKISPTSSPTDSRDSVKIHWYETLRPTHAPYFQRKITTMRPMNNQPQNQEVVDFHGCHISLGYKWCDALYLCLRAGEQHCPSGTELDSHGCITTQGERWCGSMRRCVTPQFTKCPDMIIGGFAMENRDTAHGCYQPEKWCSLSQKCYNPKRQTCVSNGESQYDGEGNSVRPPRHHDPHSYEDESTYAWHDTPWDYNYPYSR